MVNHPEEDIVAVGLMVQEQMIQFVGYGKNHVQVIHRQQVRLTVFQPSLPVNRTTFRAMPVPAAIVKDLFMATTLAMFHPSSHGFCPAKLQGTQCTRKMSGQGVLLLQFG
jgi:hypothetical protein